MNFDAIYRFLADLGYTHPLHPAVTHLTVGLVLGALVFGVIGLPGAFGKYAQTARHCCTLAFIAVFPTVVLGVMDWFHYYGASWIFPIKMKILLAGILVLLLLLSIFLNAGRTKRPGSLLLVYLLAAATVVGLGYFGGELVYGDKTSPGAGGQAGMTETRSPGQSPDFAVVEKILQTHCTNCHTGTNPPKSLNLETYSDIMEGSQNGLMVIAGSPGESELIKRVKGIKGPRMPLSGPALSGSDINAIEKWIQAGAPGPGS